MNEFKKFIQLKNYQNEILKNAKLKNITVNKFNQLSLLIELEDYVDARLLFTFTKQFKEYFSNPAFTSIDIKFKHLSKNNFEDEAVKYFENTIFYLSEIKSEILSFKEYEVTYTNGTYTIHIDEDSKWVSDYFDLIKEVFKDIDINPEIEYVVDKTIPPLSEKIENRVTNRTNRLKEITRPEPVVVESKKFYYDTKPIEVPLSKIPVDQFNLHKFENEYGKNKLKVTGEVFSIEIRAIRNFHLLEMIIFDKNDAITIKSFIYQENDLNFAKKIKEGQFVTVIGDAGYDSFSREVTIVTKDISIVEGLTKTIKKDRAKEKRVELHLHTKMSEMDGVTDVTDYVERAIQYGHKAIAFTDHNGLYAFPEVYKATKNKNIKPIYGVELDVVDPNSFFVINNYQKDIDLIDETYVVFDIETTGLSINHDDIIEIGAVKVRAGQVIDRYQSFVNPHRKLSEFIKNLTNISDEHLKDARNIDVVLKEFLEFVDDATLVAHNAAFDIRFIKENAARLNIDVNNTVIDTLNLARYFYNEKIKTFNLKSLSRYFKVELENHHRADEDANATSQVWIKMLYELRELGIRTTKNLKDEVKVEEAYKHMFPTHMTVLVKNQEGYKDLFKLVSFALTKNFYRGPRTIKEELNTYRENLLIGSSCSQGDVFESALNGNESELIENIKFYDYIEIQPPSAYQHVIDKLDENGYEIVTGTISKIINTAKRLNKLVVATGNVHYLDEDDDIYRKIFVRTPLVGGGIHPLYGSENMPKQYFRTTEEMLAEFQFLPKELAKEIVVTNTNVINDKIEFVQGFPEELYSLGDGVFSHIGIASVAEETKRIVKEGLTNQYGGNPHPIILERVERELNSIIGNKFASIYYISYLLVKKSLEDGYLVGSRGSVGSSLVATLMDITEVNPLKPHYYCSKGHFTVFELSNDEVYKYGMSEDEKSFQPYFKDVQSGYDLPEKACPICSENLMRDGHDIPFETFLGFKGDKIPDIDLNFSGEYQTTAHEYIRELVGQDHSFRAGTISRVQDRIAYGYVMGYLDDNDLNYRKSQINIMTKRITGVKRSTGQHPGGIVIVPEDKSIFDVTPIQYPANDVESNWYTTHFDYRAFEDNFLKLDILGHDDPTVIKFIMDRAMKNIDKYPFKNAKEIPLTDPNVLKLFSSTQILNLKEEDVLSEVVSFGIPEFGTPFTREMLIDTKPDSFAGLVKISGLSHGTDVWLKNSQELINGHPQYGKINFNDIIACRDDIMVQLSEMGLEQLKAFEIMEFVRKGLPSRNQQKWHEYVAEMEKHNVPEWYIWSASQIKYMFPKAHATAYVIMALRIAWFKYYDPLLFYSAFFSKKAVQFDYEKMVMGSNAIRNQIVNINNIPQHERKQKDMDLLVTFGVALEMLLRGFKFLPVDIFKSDATEFLIEEEGLRMPFVTVDGLGGQVADRIVEERNESPFTSVDDVIKRTRINKNVQALLHEYGSFGNLEQEDKTITTGLFANY